MQPGNFKIFQNAFNLDDFNSYATTPAEVNKSQKILNKRIISLLTTSWLEKIRQRSPLKYSSMRLKTTNAQRTKMEEESFEFSSLKVKQEPPEQFVMFLPSPDDDDSSAPQEEEDDVEPLADVKEEPPEEDSLLILLPSSPKEPSRPARTRQRPKKYSNDGFTIKNVLRKRKPRRKHSCPEPIHICATCDVRFSSKGLLNRHQIEFHEVVVKCEKCSYQTKNKALLIAHRGIHDKKFKCETCQKNFSKKISLKLHQMHNKHGVCATAPEVTFACEKCGKAFSSKQYLRKHRKTPHEKEVKCEECDKVCKNQLKLRDHRRNVHDQNRSTFAPLVISISQAKVYRIVPKLSSTGPCSSAASPHSKQ